MPRNISGVYSLPAGTLISNGDLSDAADLNTPLSDLESDLNAARPIVAGGTGATTAADARTNLGITPANIGAQAYDAGLQSIAGLTTAADRMLYTTAPDTYAVTTLTSFARNLLDDADAATARTTLGLGVLATAANITTAEINASAYASRAEAEAGTDNTKLMTPLRVKQARSVVWGAAQATTSGTAIDFSGIPSNATEIFVFLDGVSLNGTDHLLIQLGTSGGFVSTGYIGHTGAVSNTGYGAVTSTSGFPVFSALAAAASCGLITFSLVDAAAYTWAVSGTSSMNNGTGAFCDGIVDLGGVLTSLRLTRTGTNTFDAGAINVGYR